MTKTTIRPAWDEYCLKLAEVARLRSTCLRRQVGAVLTTNTHMIIAIAYNGPPIGALHCSELGGCLREKLHIPSGTRQELCRAVHAEQNLILIAARYGASTLGTTMYCLNFPCVTCAKLLVQAGVKKIVYCNVYGDNESKSEALKVFKQSNIELVKRTM